MKRFMTILMVIIVLITLASCDSSEKETKAPQEALKRDIIALELAERYQAVTGWEENLTYTLQAQERLITEKPVLFRCYIDDIFSRDGKTFIRFSPSYLGTISYVNYRLELECNGQILQTLLSQKQDNGAYSEYFDEYAIVANIREVYKPVFTLRGAALSEDEVEIDVESSYILIIKGICLDVVNIGDGI